MASRGDETTRQLPALKDRRDWRLALAHAKTLDHTIDDLTWARVGNLLDVIRGPLDGPTLLVLARSLR